MHDTIDTLVCFEDAQINMTARVLHRKKNAPTCIYLLGALQEISTIKLFSDELSKHYNYLAIEVPGTGDTDPLNPKYSFDFIAECLNSILLQKVGDEPIRIVACSYGTATAVAFAQKYPQRVIQMALCGSMYDIPQQYWSTMLDLMHRAQNERETFAEGFISLLTAPIPAIANKQDQILRVTMRKTKQFQDRHFDHFTFNTLRLMTHDPGDLKSIKAPVLVITGEYDPYCTVENAKKLAHKFPNGSFNTITNCDHLFHIEDPHQLMVKVMLFFMRYRFIPKNKIKETEVESVVIQRHYRGQ